MSVEDDLVGLLEDDENLAEYLTGGLHVAKEISRQRTPDAFDQSGEILPCALVKSGTEVILENKTGAVQTPVTIYLYEREGYANIIPALGLIYSLLEMQHLNGTWQIRFNNEIARTTDESLKCSLAVQRWIVIRKKNYQ